MEGTSALEVSSLNMTYNRESVWLRGCLGREKSLEEYGSMGQTGGSVQSLWRQLGSWVKESKSWLTWRGWRQVSHEGQTHGGVKSGRKWCSWGQSFRNKKNIVAVRRLWLKGLSKMGGQVIMTMGQPARYDTSMKERLDKVMEGGRKGSMGRRYPRESPKI